MKKQILAVFGIIIIAAAMIAGCSRNETAVDTEASTEPTSKIVAASDTSKPAESTTVAESKNTDSLAENTTIRKENGSTTTTKKEAAKTTTQAAPKTTAQQTTKSTTAATTKATTVAPTTTRATTTTTKPNTTIKNVSAKDVQAQVNSYIRSKGITVDSSLNSSNSGWSGEISGTQERLNNGRSFQLCKEYVDMEISSMGTDISLYCYYNGDCFYICYM